MPYFSLLPQTIRVGMAMRPIVSKDMRFTNISQYQLIMDVNAPGIDHASRYLARSESEHASGAWTREVHPQVS